MNIYAPLEHAFHISWVLQATVLAAGLLLFGGLVLRRQIAAADKNRIQPLDVDGEV